MGFELKAKMRKSFGKGDSRKLRSSGSIPAVIYGHQKESIPVIINFRETERIIETGATRQIHTLNIEERGEPIQVMYKEIQRDPVSNAVLHVDFYEIQKGQMFNLVLPVNLIGKPFGVTDQGGAMQFVTRSLHVRCIPENIPPSIDVQVESLKLGDSIHVRDLPENDLYKIVDDPNKVLVSVAVIKAAGPEEAPKEEEAASAEAGATPEQQEKPQAETK